MTTLIYTFNRWEETVTVKEKVLKQRDHLVKLEKEQKQLMDTMIAFQLDSTMQVFTVQAVR